MFPWGFFTFLPLDIIYLTVVDTAEYPHFFHRGLFDCLNNFRHHIGHSRVYHISRRCCLRTCRIDVGKDVYFGNTMCNRVFKIFIRQSRTAVQHQWRFYNVRNGSHPLKIQFRLALICAMRCADCNRQCIYSGALCIGLCLKRIGINGACIISFRRAALVCADMSQLTIYRYCLL